MLTLETVNKGTVKVKKTSEGYEVTNQFNEGKYQWNNKVIFKSMDEIIQKIGPIK